MGKIKLSDLTYAGPDVVETNESVEPAAEHVEIESPTSPEVIDDIVEEESSIESEELPEPVTSKSIKQMLVKVNKLAIRSTPSLKVPARLYTGVVEITGQVDHFLIVKYVKHGFGLVKGYVVDSAITF